MSDLLELKVKMPEMLIEHLVPTPGLTVVAGQSKAGKTLFCAQAAISIASRKYLFDYYSVSRPGGGVLFVEHDDPGGMASFKQIQERSRILTPGAPIVASPAKGFSLNLELIEWLELEIKERDLTLIVLDSYTSLRPSRKGGSDLVKAEAADLTMLDELAKKHGMAIILIHHHSKGSSALDWSQQAGGSFAIAAASECVIHLTRFPELDSAAPERLVRARGRHFAGTEIALRFREETLDFDFIMSGGASSLYPNIEQIRSAFGKETFSPKKVHLDMGVSISNAHRIINRLTAAGCLTRLGYGEYRLN